MEIREQIKVLRAFKRGSIIEYYNENSKKWVEIGNNRFTAFDFSREKYRIKPRLTYVPFNENDFELFCDIWVMCKKSNSIKFKVIYCDNQFIGFPGFVKTYEECFNDYLFIDGTPFGKLA